jgi:WD40 repeat protein
VNIRFPDNNSLFSSVLQDDNIKVEGDLYIRSVCFSPDGNYLATGAEDMQIRVSIYICN